MIGRIGDFFNFWWSLVYWNTRKTWYRARGKRSRPPCQNPSDSGNAHETGCEAANHWNNPASFRLVCPLLVKTPDGLRCSVDAPDVRPFWGRAAGWFGGLFGSIWLTGVILVFCVFRIVGYEVSLFSLAWPPAWSDVRIARAVFFKEQAASLFNQNDFKGGLLALSQSYDLDPRQYEVGIELARRWQLSGQPHVADQTFASLMETHTERRAATAEIWFRSLLPRGDFRRIQALAANMLLEDEPSQVAWTRALLFAVKRTGEASVIENLLEQQETLGPAFAWILESELALLEYGRAALEERFSRPIDPMPHPFLGFYHIQTLIHHREHRAAIELLERYQGQIGALEETVLKWEVYHREGWTDQVASEVESVLPDTFNPKVAEFFLAFLIRHPNPKALATVHSWIRRTDEPVDLSLKFALYCAAGFSRDWSRLAETRSEINEELPRRFLLLDELETFFRGRSPASRPETFLHLLDLPLEAVYAVLDAAPAQPDGPRRH